MTMARPTLPYVADPTPKEYRGAQPMGAPGVQQPALQNAVGDHAGIVLGAPRQLGRGDLAADNRPIGPGPRRRD